MRDGKRARHHRTLDAERADRTHHDLVDHLVGEELVLRSSSTPNSSNGWKTYSPTVGDHGDLERGDDDMTVAVPLDVQDRVADGDRELVPQLGGVDGVGEDQDV